MITKKQLWINAKKETKEAENSLLGFDGLLKCRCIQLRNHARFEYLNFQYTVFRKQLIRFRTDLCLACFAVKMVLLRMQNLMLKEAKNLVLKF